MQPVREERGEDDDVGGWEERRQCEGKQAQVSQTTAVGAEGRVLVGGSCPQQGDIECGVETGQVHRVLWKELVDVDRGQGFVLIRTSRMGRRQAV